MGQQAAIAFPPAQPPFEERLLKRDDVTAMTTLSRAEIYRRMKDGRFPQSIPLGPMSVAWRLSDVQRWIEQLRSAAAASNAHPALATRGQTPEPAPAKPEPSSRKRPRRGNKQSTE